MKIMGMGLDLQGRPLFPAIEEAILTKTLIAALEHNAAAMQQMGQISAIGATFKSELERKVQDPGDPLQAGWTYLIHTDDPQRAEITEILAPLARHRGMDNPKQPMLYYANSAEEWFDWLHDEYLSLELEVGRTPQYVMLVGGPERIPFGLQAILDISAKVGRIAFDSLDELQQYVDKLIRIETAAVPLVRDDILMFAPDAGPTDATYFSREYMVKPLSEHICQEIGFSTRSLMAHEATRARLEQALGDGSPALVYTASHGLGAMSEPDEIQRRFNGAIVCQHEGPLRREDLFAAEDVPSDQPFLEGSVFFQFACFSYGTPAQSDYAHWIDNVPKQYTQDDFIGALPKKLLAHPRGPIAFIGHLDTAWLHGFADVESPHILDRWHSRIQPFVHSINQLLRLQPVSLAMEEMNKRYSTTSAMLADTYDRQRRGRYQWNRRKEERFINSWIVRGDAQNYMIFGDPAARLRISTA
ncbi:hypothetical protein GC175_33850 [bacterium]|nr:hypothetical protein [bacterium]